MLLQQDDFQGAPASIALFARRVHGIDSHLKVDDFLEGRAKGKTIIGCYSIEEMVVTLAKPARVRLMVKAGKVVDQFIAQVLPHLTTGDIIIDGGTSAVAPLLFMRCLSTDACAATGTTPTVAIIISKEKAFCLLELV